MDICRGAETLGKQTLGKQICEGRPPSWLRNFLFGRELRYINLRLGHTPRLASRKLFDKQHMGFLSFYEDDKKRFVVPGLGGWPDMGRSWKMAFCNLKTNTFLYVSGAVPLIASLQGFPSGISNCKYFAANPVGKTDLPPFYSNCLRSIL